MSGLGKKYFNGGRANSSAAGDAAAVDAFIKNVLQDPDAPKTPNAPTAKKPPKFPKPPKPLNNLSSSAKMGRQNSSVFKAQKAPQLQQAPQILQTPPFNYSAVYKKCFDDFETHEKSLNAIAINFESVHRQVTYYITAYQFFLRDLQNQTDFLEPEDPKSTPDDLQIRNFTEIFSSILPALLTNNFLDININIKSKPDHPNRKEEIQKSQNVTQCAFKKIHDVINPPLNRLSNDERLEKINTFYQNIQNIYMCVDVNKRNLAHAYNQKILECAPLLCSDVFLNSSQKRQDAIFKCLMANAGIDTLEYFFIKIIENIKNLQPLSNLNELLLPPHKKFRNLTKVEKTKT